MSLKIEMGIGWIPNPEKPGGLISADISDYVAEINRLRLVLAEIADDPTGVSTYQAEFAKDALGIPIEPSC